MTLNRINIKITFALFVCSLFATTIVAENNWNVPTDKKARNSYIKFDATASSQGESIYIKNCVSCHGDIGKNNSLQSLTPIPPDLGSANSQEFTDGELFYILSTGRGVMPSFQNVLSEEDRWKTISYIRGFNKNYVQTISKFDPNKSKLVKVDLKYDLSSHNIQVLISANEKTGKIAVKDAEVAVFVTRHFGRLQIDKSTKTDVNGNANFKFPTDIPGDKTGNLELIIKVTDQNYGEIESSYKLKIGVPTDKPALTANRAIWGVLAKAPFWIIGLYSFGILCFGLILLYIFNNLRKIYKSKKH